MSLLRWGWGVETPFMRTSTATYKITQKDVLTYLFSSKIRWQIIV